MKSEDINNSHSWWWDSHISPENLKWFAENLEGVDQSVKEIHKLLEEDGDSLAKKRPELIARVEEFWNIHQALAERYEHLTGQLKKNVPSVLQIQTPGFSGSTDQASLFLTPDQKSGGISAFSLKENSELFLTADQKSCGISAFSLKENSEFSLSQSSDSDSESSFSSSTKKHSESCFNVDPKGLHQVNVELDMDLPPMEKKESKGYETLLRQVTEYEEALRISNIKLQSSEEQVARLKGELEKNEHVNALVKDLQSKLESAHAFYKTSETDLEMERRIVLELQEQIADMDTQLSDLDDEIKGLHVTLCEANTSFSLEKLKFEADISGLIEQRDVLEARVKELEFRSKSQELEISRCETEKMVGERSLLCELGKLKWEISEKNGVVEALNKRVDGLKLQYDMLMAEKDGLVAKLQSLQTLVVDVISRDNRIQQLEEYSNQIREEHESARKKVNELEKEVNIQRNVISEREEEKREAIRQLCFSIEHYRSGYKQLLQAFIPHKRHAVFA